MMTPKQREYLEANRKLIDNLDDALLDLLVHRAQVVDALWQWKEQQALPRTDPAREGEVVERLLTRAETKGLSRDAVRPLLTALIGKKLLAG
jgi:chorismate mutase